MMKTEIGSEGGTVDPPTAAVVAAAAAAATATAEAEVVAPAEPQATALQDLIAGGMAGSVSVVVGHPFDTYKVRLQTGGGSGGSSASSRQFGGARSLLRGMSAPLGTAAVVNAVIFSSFGESSRYWDEYVGETFLHQGRADRTPAQAQSDERRNSMYKSIVCGSFAGAVQCLVVCPMEHIKCRLQIQHGVGAADHLYRGPLDAVDKIVEGHGVRGLYRGLWATCWREIPAFGLYFATYDDIKDRANRLFEENGAGPDGGEYVPRHSHTWAASAFAGGMAGSLTWALIYPIDVIKSRIQTASLDCARSEIYILNVGRKIVREQGWRFLFRGLGVTLARAFPVNGIIFPVYEFTLMRLTGAGIGGSSS